MIMIRSNPQTGEQFEYDDGRPAPVKACWCPCCGYKTLVGRGHYEICSVCFWEDDGQDDADADVIRGGPNNVLRLTVARQNFLEFGACEQAMLEHVRPPLESELVGAKSYVGLDKSKG